MSAETIATTLADKQGWTDATLLDLCLTYIDNQGANDAFTDYLTAVAGDENLDANGPVCADCGLGDPDLYTGTPEEAAADFATVRARDSHRGAILCDDCADDRDHHDDLGDDDA